MAQIYFFDLPVYRLSYEKYNKLMDGRLNDQLDRVRQIPSYEPPRSTIDRISQHQYEKFGPWRFNEILGHIRLHFLGSQVRGEYFSAEKKRNPIGRHRVFTFKTLKLAYETEIRPPYRATNPQVWAAIQDYIEKCRIELTKGRVIDDSVLKAIGPHVDWLSILGWK